MAQFARGSYGLPIQRLRARLGLDNADGPRQKNILPDDPMIQPFDAALEEKVRAFQRDNLLAETGTVDEALHRKLFPNDPFPDVFERALMIVGLIEGHGFFSVIKADGGLPDAAGITMGIIGFQATSGSLNSLFKDILKPLTPEQRIKAFTDFGISDDERKAFEKFLDLEGEDNRRGAAGDLFLRFPKKGERGMQVIDRWHAFFRAHLRTPHALRQQVLHARAEYFDKATSPALAKLCKRAEDAAAARDLKSDLGRTLALSACIQHGNFLGKPVAANERENRIEGIIRFSPNAGKVRANFEARHIAIAKGLGFPNRLFVDVSAWGFPEADPPPPARTRILSLAFSDSPSMASLPKFEAAAVAKTIVQDRVTESAAVTGLLDAVNASRTKNGIADLSAAWSPAQHMACVRLFAQLDELPLQCLVIGGALERGRGVDAIRRKKAPLRLVQKNGILSWDAADLELAFVPKLRGGLLVLFIPSAFPDTALRFQSAIETINGRRPLVVGWKGAVDFPGVAGPHCGEALFDQLKLKIPASAATLDALIAKEPETVIQAWGRACHDVFDKSTFQGLWRHPAAAEKPLLTCAAVAPDRSVWTSVAAPANDVFMKKS